MSTAASAKESRLVNAVRYFCTGYVFAGLFVILGARLHDDSWVSGVVMLSLSLPVTIAYFVGIWAVRHYRSGQVSRVGILIAGILAAVYPAFCGFFPLYFVRPMFAVPLFVLQFGLVLLVSGVASKPASTE